MISFWMLYAFLFFLVMFVTFIGSYVYWYQENRFDRLATKIHRQKISIYQPEKDPDYVL
jgi:uncharacterized membrane protein (DUF485 family)